MNDADLTVVLFFICFFVMVSIVVAEIVDVLNVTHVLLLFFYVAG